MESAREQEKQMERRVAPPRAPDSPTPIGSAEDSKLILQMIRRQEKEDRQYRARSSSPTREKASSDALSKQRVEAPRASQRLTVSFDKHLQTMTSSMEQAFSRHAEEQQLKQQSDLELIWKRFTEELSKREADYLASQQARDELYEARINKLELKIQNLQEQLPRLESAAKKQGKLPQPPPPRKLWSEIASCREKEKENTHTPAQIPTGASQAQLNGPAARHKVSERSKEVRGALTFASAPPTEELRTNEWHTVTISRKRASKLKELSPVKRADKEARRLIFRREDKDSEVKADKADIILELNQALTSEAFPSFVRVVDAGYTLSGAITVLLSKEAVNTMLLPFYSDLLLTAVRHADPGVVSVEAPEQWYRLKVHGVPTRRYLNLGLELARREIESGGNLRLKRNPTWLRNPRELRESTLKGSTIVITVGSWEEAHKISADGIRFGGTRYKVEPYWELGPDTICPRCCGIGHRSFRACGDRPSLCFICAGPHEGLDHACKVTTCHVKPGRHCHHMPAKCGNCGGSHLATARSCPKQKEARKRHSTQKVRIQPEAQNDAQKSTPQTTSRVEPRQSFAVVIDNSTTELMQCIAEVAKQDRTAQAEQQSPSEDTFMRGALTPRRTSGPGINWAQCG